ncbi:OadG family protein [Phascolarctobacterium faecium]|uniref:OadG family protein n=1 Tax=Phascolarctobacterium faecium TaxID=33025 RepID=UPI00300F7971
MGPVTTNPWLISIINMTIVFGVLAALGVLMKIIQLVDPTQKKTEKPVAAPAPAAVAAPAQDDSEVIAVIAAAVAALGHSAEDIAYVRRLPEAGWTQNARIEAISVRKECF